MAFPAVYVSLAKSWHIIGQIAAFSISCHGRQKFYRILYNIIIHYMQGNDPSSIASQNDMQKTQHATRSTTTAKMCSAQFLYSLYVIREQKMKAF